MSRICAVLLCSLVATACAQDTLESLLQEAYDAVAPLDAVVRAINNLRSDFGRETYYLHLAADPNPAIDMLEQINSLRDSVLQATGVDEERQDVIADGITQIYDAVRFTGRFETRIHSRTDGDIQDVINDAFSVVFNINQEIQTTAGNTNACGERSAYSGYYAFGDHCYSFNWASSRFYDIHGNNLCGRLGMNYAKIESQEEQDFIANIIETHYAGQNHWVGLRRTPSTYYDWMLDNSHSVDGYQNWGDGQPVTSQPCGYMSSSTGYKWRTIDCNQYYQYICEST